VDPLCRSSTNYRPQVSRPLSNSRPNVKYDNVVLIMTLPDTCYSASTIHEPGALPNGSPLRPPQDRLPPLLFLMTHPDISYSASTLMTLGACRVDIMTLPDIFTAPLPSKPGGLSKCHDPTRYLLSRLYLMNPGGCRNLSFHGDISLHKRSK
jgi:hypothetical protein